MKFDPRLYLVTDSTGLEEKDFLNIVEEACIGGVTLVQLREKEITDREYLDLGFKVKDITDKYDIPLLIDDRIDIAMILNCGVHLGQDDIPIEYARELLGKDRIIGATTKTVDQALEAEKSGADYLGVGAIFPTTTKVKTVITEVSTLDSICENVSIPVMAIGGLNIDNYRVLRNSPIDGICLVSAIMKKENPRLEAEKLRKAVESFSK